MKGLEHYDRQGKPISFMEAAEKLADDSYRVVGQIASDNGLYWVSTVWVGLNVGYGPTAHALGLCIFESVVEHRESGEALERHRYATEAQALAGHAALVAKYNHPYVDVVQRLTGE